MSFLLQRRSRIAAHTSAREILSKQKEIFMGKKIKRRTFLPVKLFTMLFYLIFLRIVMGKKTKILLKVEASHLEKF